MRIIFVCAPGRERSVDFLSEKLVAAVQRQIFGLSKKLALRGHEVYIIRRWSSRNPFEYHNGIHFVNIQQSYPLLKMGEEDSLLFREALSSFFVHFAYSIKALKKIRMINPDIVNISSLLLGFFISRAIKPLKVYITHSHDIYVHDAPYGHWKKFMLRRALPNFDAIVALTPSIRGYLEKMGFRIDAVIPNGVDPDEYTAENDNAYVLYAGRLAKHKKVMDLLESFSSIERKTSSELVIIGEGPEKRALTEWVNRKNIQQSVHFLPFLSQTEYRNTLSQCSVFVLPSVKEAFGVVIIEAMASGKPVIARNIIGPKDIITHGQDGFLFENNDELKKYLKLLLSDEELRKKIGKNARRTSEEKYTFEKISKQYLKLYESLIN